MLPQAFVFSGSRNLILLLIGVSAYLVVAKPAWLFHRDPVVVTEYAAWEAEGLLDKGRGHPQVLYLYASTCGPCRSILKGVNALAEDCEDAGVGFTAVALDEDPDRLEAYLTKEGAVFSPVWLTPSDKWSLVDGLKRRGSDLSNSLSTPYFVILDDNAQVAAEWAGTPGLKDAREELKREGVKL